MSWLLQLLDKNSPNPSTRLELSEQIIDQLSHNRLPSDSKILNALCDVVFQWMSASNFKVALQAIEVCNTALDISGDVLAPYLLERSPALVERLGDSKPQVRDAVTNLLIDLSNTPHCSHQTVLEKISPGFGHKQWLVKCGTMNVYRLLLDEAREDLEMQTNRLVPLLCKLMADPNNDVRETSMNTIVHVMIVLGESVAVSIRNRRLIPDAKMQLLMQRYEDALRRGSVPSAVARPIRVQRRFEPRAQSASFTRNGSNGSLRDEQENIGARRPMMMAKKPPVRSTGAAGVVTEDEVRKNFEKVPKKTISSKNDVKQQLEESKVVLEKTDIDWDKRNNSLQLIRSVVVNGGLDYEAELIASLLRMEDAMVKSVTDLRSQVCKEACITVCLLAERLGNKLAPLFEVILPRCVPLIQNSAKVMASSSQQACDFIIKNIHTARIMQAILDSLSHKSKEIRAHCHYLILLALQNWPAVKLEKHVKDISNAIRCGIADADPGARKNAREGYQQLDVVFPAQAQALFKTLDPSKQKTLSGGGSAASSAQSIHSLRDAVPFTKRPGTTGLNRPSAFLSGRSASAIDTSSARIAAVSSPKFPLNRNLGSTPVRPGTGGPARAVVSSASKPRPVAPLRTATANSSQPSSRSGSPTRQSNRLPPRIGQRATSSVSHSNGFHHEEKEDLFSQINNLTLQATYDDEDFLLGTGPSSPISQLNVALKKCASHDANEKKDGLKMIQDIIRTSRSSDGDVKKIVDAVMKFIMEGNSKFLSLLADTTGELVSRYPGNFDPAQLLTLVSRLLSKSSQELIPSNQTLWKKMLKEVRESFRPDDLLIAVCKYIDGNMNSPQSPKARCTTVQYLHELVSNMDIGTPINRVEVKCALEKIFTWLEDPKNHDIKPHFVELLPALFHVNTADYATILSSFKPEWKNLGFVYCQKENARREELEVSPIIRRSPISHVGLDMPDNFRKYPSPSLGPILNTSEESSEGNRSNLAETTHLAHDEHKQTDYIKQLLHELAIAKSTPTRREHQILAMQQLHQMISEGSFTTWDENFKLLILQLFDILSMDDTVVKKEAVRLLSRLCTVQACRFYEYGEMTVTKVLSTTMNEKDSYFINVVDECLKTLAVHLPIPKTLNTLNPIIATMTDPRIPSALKMLQKMIEGWPQDNLKPYLAEFVPGLVQCYKCTDSAARKNTIFCLVPLVNKFGPETMNQYLATMEAKAQKLLDVYVQRDKTASNHF